MGQTTSDAKPHVLVLGNHKGGSGKSTLAVHLAIGLMKEGRRVACIDLDFQQKTLTHYLNNRTAWSRERNLPIDIPNHLSVDSPRTQRPVATENGRMSRLTAAIASLQIDHDFIVVDTPGGASSLGLFAHSLADTLITPVNDSFLDLDVIIQSKEGTEEPFVTPQYFDTVRHALAARSGVTKDRTNWLVVRNRVAALASRNTGNVLAALTNAASAAGFCLIEGLSERVIFRELFSAGLTAFDTSEIALIGAKPSSSNVLARLEVRRVLHAIHQFRNGAKQDPARTVIPEKHVRAFTKADGKAGHDIREHAVLSTRS
jgi:chromosome partitioning protein